MREIVVPRVDPGWEKYFELLKTDTEASVVATPGVVSLSPTKTIRSNFLRTTPTSSRVIGATSGTEQEIVGKHIGVGAHTL